MRWTPRITWSQQIFWFLIFPGLSKNFNKNQDKKYFNESKKDKQQTRGKVSFISKQRLIYLIDKELLKIKEVVNNRNAKTD